MSAYVEYALSLQSFVHMASVEQTTQQALYSSGGGVPVVAPIPQGAGQIIPGSKARPRVSTTLWEDENTLCFQVEARGISVARREDNDMINGTKLLNVAGMTRGRRDGMLKAEKDRRVVKIGAMHLKGVWIPFDRAINFAQKEGIADLLFPLLVEDIRSYLYRQTNPAGAEIPLILPGEQQKYQQSPAQKPAGAVQSQTPPTAAAATQQQQQQYGRQYPQGYAAPPYGMQGQYAQPIQGTLPGSLQGNVQHQHQQAGLQNNYPGYQYTNYPQMMYQSQGQPQGQQQAQQQGADASQPMYYQQPGYQQQGYEYQQFYKKE